MDSVPFVALTKGQLREIWKKNGEKLYGILASGWNDPHLSPPTEGLGKLASIRRMVQRPAGVGSGK